MEEQDSYKSVGEFLAKLDAGELDGRLSQEVQKLTSEQQNELGRILMERDAGKSNRSAHGNG